MKKFQLKKATALLSASMLALSVCSFIPVNAMAADVTITSAAAVPGDGYAANVKATIAGAAVGDQVSVSVYPKSAAPYDVMNAKHLDQIAYANGVDYGFELGMNPTPGMYTVVLGATNVTAYATKDYETNVIAPALIADPLNPKTIDITNIGDNAKFCFIPSDTDANTTYFLKNMTATTAIVNGKTVPCTVVEDMVCVDAASVLAAAPAGPMALNVSIKSVGFEAASATASVNLITGGNIPVDNVTVSASASTVKKGTTIQLKVNIMPDNATDKSVTWSSSSTSVATVDANGVVTGLKTGTVRITATTSNGKSYMFLLMVTA